MSINGIVMSDHSTSWRNRKAQKNILGTNFALHMSGANMGNADDQASGTASGNGTVAGTSFGRDTYVSGASGIHAAGVYFKDTEPPDCHGQRPLPRNEANTPSGGQDTDTSSEIIVRPDGSRVLMITVDIGGTQTAMSLQISEPTDVQNDIAKQESDSNGTPIHAAALTVNDISGSVNGE